MSKDFIPVNEPFFGGNEKAYLDECIESGWVSSAGPFVRRFEKSFAERIGRCHGITVSNGSDALRLAVVALGIGAGDEVIMPAFTIISCATAIVRAGATPVLVDSHPDTWNMDVTQIENRITPRTKAIMVVHTYGLPVDMDPVLDLAKRRGLLVIEDAAEAIGLDYRSRPCGSMGDISVFSFYANKHVTMGEGGFLTTDDAALAEKCLSMRNLCFGEDRFRHDELGWNMRITNLQAALGLAQLEQLDTFIQRKRRMGRHYTERLEGSPNLRLPVDRTDYAENVYWVYGVVIEDTPESEVQEIVGRLREAGIGTRPFFWPMHEQPVFKKMGLFAGERHPVAEHLARQGFYLPSGLGLRDDRMDHVIDVFTGLIC